MQLGSSTPSGPAAAHVADAIRSGAATLGHRPAVTVLHPDARYEQSGVSLANWAAKGAHLLELDHGVAAGDAVTVLSGACWTTATAALSTWWLGGVVHLTAQADARVAVTEPGGPAAGDGPATLLVGDGLDGAPRGSDVGPSWTREALPMPDHPPAARAAGHLPALVTTGRSWTQAELLAVAIAMDEGTAGVEVGVTDPATALIAVALRPLVTGRTTVVLRGVDREAALQERVSVWL